MLQVNNALGYAVSQKIALNRLNSDRLAVIQSFEMDVDDTDWDSGFEFLAKRLASEALETWMKIAVTFKRTTQSSVINGVQVKHLRAGEKDDILWLKREIVQGETVDGRLVETLAIEAKGTPPSYKKALPGNMSTKQAVVIDSERNETENSKRDYPKVLEMTQGKYLVKTGPESGGIFNNKIKALVYAQEWEIAWTKALEDSQK